MYLTRRDACLALAFSLAAAAAGFASGGYENGWVSGSGHVTTASRDVPFFTAIELEGSGNVTIRPGASRAVVVETDDNILPLVRTDVVDGVLHLGLKPGTRVGAMTRLEYTVAAPRLAALAISGSGNARTTAVLHGDTLSLDIRGSGSVQARGLSAVFAEIRVNGSGDAAVTASTTLDVTVAGSGSVQYGGAAKLSVRTTGSGSVRRY